ncbi:GNAT family N-acetyltransferase [Cohnella nanjingensis]|uniref:GNAT family N-acetyltransferase n=1 Tax=Cohnella nanjingensis TaxID=1387779 RepID=A0A7X0VHS2_9BACL|nr:GNAT family N-acetyltransferase [Cohnella nanjingensis]MBB6673778.1 GNAT family N-acetyltransferase [Cohnella nanjingensis]
MTKTNHLALSTLTQDDILFVCQIFKYSISDAFEKEGLGHLHDDIQKEIEDKKQLALTSLDPTNSDTYFLIAKLNEAVVGTISFGPCGEAIQSCTENQLDDVGELGSIYVLPSCQGQGVGSNLIKGMLTYLKKQGIDQFCLDSGYKRAQTRWLRKFGEPYKVVKDYWGPDSDHMVWLCKVSDYID